LAALPLRAADFNFTDATTQAEFQKFSRIVGQAIFATPVQPARASGLLGFDVGVAANVVNVDSNASYWLHSVSSGSNILVHGNYVGVPRLVVSKGFGFGTVSGMYAKVSNSDIKTYGGALDVPVLRGSVVIPEVAFRGSYSTLSGADVFKQKVYGAEFFVSKGFGPVTPYGAVGRMRTDSTGYPSSLNPTFAAVPPLIDRSNFNRYTVGLRLSLLVPKIVIEATQAEVRSYAAKISVGF